MIQVKDIHSEIESVWLNGTYKTMSTGSHQLDTKLKLIKGFPWFIGGQPHHGKTEVVMELMLKWSIMYGWKHYCYFGEGGNVESIVADLCHKYVGKSFRKNSQYGMNDAERYDALEFIGNHFYFSNPEQNLSYDRWLKEVDEAERLFRVKFDTTLIDPFNDLEYDLGKYPNITYWLKDVLKDVRNSSKRNNRNDILVVHVGETQIVTDKSTGNQYQPPALPSQWEGGKIWNRRAFVQLNVWRNLEGQTQIIVNKAKPKEAKVYGDGDKVLWAWDWKRNRYKEDRNGYFRDVLTIDEPDYNPHKGITNLNGLHRGGYAEQPEEEPPF